MSKNDLLDQLISAGIEESEAKKELIILEKEFKNDLKKIKETVEIRSKTRKPLQYILGNAYFMDFELIVNKNVFIPRSETEILVDECIKRIQKHSSFVTRHSSLDIGTGSGVIAIALARQIPDIKIVAIDINKKIINVAKENAKRYAVDKKITFQVCDLFSDDFEKLLEENKFDLIISNPPYIVNRNLQPEIKHEPQEALFGNVENHDGLAYYKRIIDCCRGGVTPPLLAFEIDPCLVNDLKKINDLENLEFVKDYNGLERCLFINLSK